MDTDKGYCWKCGFSLPRRKYFTCDSCKIAEYCGKQCRSTDANRHGTVECPTWSPKKCANCRQHGSSECAGCLSVWYCGVKCQKEDWAKHKPICKSWREKAKDASRVPRRLVQEFPYYFSNVIATDLLKLPSNELEQNEDVDELNLLLAACGDLRHLMESVHSLPSKFEGQLRFVLNDIDPFVMARNVLLLFMMVTCSQEKVKHIASIWLSLRLSKNDYRCLQTTLSTLCGSDSESVKNVTNSVIVVEARSFKELKKVWSRWEAMPCLLGDDGCIPLGEERMASFAVDGPAQEGFAVLYNQVPLQYVGSMRSWLEDGIIVAADDQRESLPYYNPTFTGRAEVVSQTPQNLDPSNYSFHFCIKTDGIPFQMWDYLRMINVCGTSDPSITSMCHAYTQGCILATMKLMTAKRLFLEIHTEDYTTLQGKLSRSSHGKFDRIYTSNLMDFQPIPTILGSLKVFLSNNNPCAVIIMDTLNWMRYCRESDFPVDFKTTLRHISADYPMTVMNFGKAQVREYHDNIAYFVTYLRGRRIGDDQASNNDATGLPKWSELTKCEGLTMRDFRKTRNKVWPFRQRVIIRSMNMSTGRERTLEWYRGQST